MILKTHHHFPITLMAAQSLDWTSPIVIFISAIRARPASFVSNLLQTFQRFVALWTHFLRHRPV